MAETEVKSLVDRRGQLKAQLTRFTNFINEIAPDNNDKIAELRVRLERLEGIFNEFDMIQSQIEIFDEGQGQSAERGYFEDRYYPVIARARELIKNNVNIQMLPTGPSAQFNVKLPQLSLPEFSGAYEKWCQFYDTFNSLIHENPSLSNIQKYYYLQASLKDEAAEIIHNLEMTEANYPVAWELLRSRFENKKIIIKSHMKAIFEFQPVIKDSHTSLRHFLDSFQKHFRALKNLREPVESWDTILLYLLVSKLDISSKKEWEIKTNNEVSPSTDAFITFLTDRCKLLESIDNKGLKGFTQVTNTRKTYENKVHAHIATNSRCHFCKGDHWVNTCKEFLELPIWSRLNEIRKRRVCTNCLRLGHSSQDCRSSSCRICNKKHNTLLHLEKQTSDTPISRSRVNSYKDEGPQQSSSENSQARVSSRVSYSQTISSDNDSSPTAITTHCNNNTFVILSTALIHIFDKQGNPITCRALLDSGSQSNFMTSSLNERLGLNTRKINLPVKGINSNTTKVTRVTQAKIQSIHSSYHVNLQFLILNKITDNIPQFNFDRSSIVIPESIVMADPAFEKSSEVDVLLGANIFFDLLSVGQIKLGNNKPTLQKSKLGWIISGPLEDHSQVRTICNLSVTDNIEKQLESFWLIEECSKKQVIYSKEESECEQHFVDNFQRDKSGRFTVKLPLRDNYAQLGDTEELAIQRFHTLERKLAKNAVLKEQYCQFMNEYITMGHMSSTEPSQLQNNIVYYLPHHCIQKESSLTTKLRVVFDASAKSTTDLSLNDVLKVGPNIQEDIFSILLRFRCHNIVFTADIAKMYRQINIHEDHRDLQRIVWRSDPNEPLTHYKLNTVTYGTSSASFLATRCLKHLALEHQSNFPNASHSILHDFYMDDWISGASDLCSAIRLTSEVSDILTSAGLQLRQWNSNESRILNAQQDQNPDYQYMIKENQNQKTLGIYWNAANDEFQYLTNAPACNQITKRIILSIVSQIYDPLGLISPVIIKAKLILQTLWQLKVNWDETIPPELLNMWSQFYHNITSINDIKIPRHVILRDASHIQMHCFTDASQSAYGACVYFRARDTKGKLSVCLACAKSRVAPLKTLSLPRLELCGALLGAQLCQRARQSIKLNIDSIHYWCDSTIVLAWIKTEPSRLKTFVSNRVSQIQIYTQNIEWNHVPTNYNPADVVSRGVNPSQLANAELWWYGPPWLAQEPESWPRPVKLKNDVIPELKNTTSTCLSVAESDIITRYSSLTKLLHVVGYLFRFKNNATSRPDVRLTGKLTIEELEHATRIIVRLVQAQEFLLEILTLKNSKSVSSKSKLCSLSPFLDENDIIRVGGRLINSQLEFGVKFPIVIPYKHHFTTLIIRHEHNKNLHAGPQAILSCIRSRYWPLNGRQCVRRVLRDCVTCFRAKPPSISCKMGNLPAARVTPSRAFLICGVDFAGPFLIKDSKFRNKTLLKAYICVFICFSSKAMHLELVTDLSADSFLNALKRFVSRRGLCSDIYSDNATNFVGANKHLRELINLTNNDDFQNYLLHNRITWHFIPPRSPHFGGLWESAVRLTKYHLKRIIHDVHLSYEELYTLLTQIEAILNSRPLVPLTNDPNDLEALTPGHLLIGERLTAIPEVKVLDNRSTHVSRYKHLRLLAQHFWSRWTRDYLHTLQQRTKWQCNSFNNVPVGSLVILREDNTPPLHWKMGRIVQVHPGKDGVVRVVTVKTNSGLVKRAVVKISILPIETD